MNKVLPIYKPIGATPLQIIDALRSKYPLYAKEKIGYAGRLDPMAHGVLLLMIGDAAKERDKYLGLSKEYEFEVLFGVETDSYDVLGIVSDLFLDKPKDNNEEKIVKEKVNIFVKRYIGKCTLPYPPYSSKAVNGKPLFWWARHNKLSEITIPERETEITGFELLSFDIITTVNVRRLVLNKISSVAGDFRQDEIITRWEKFLDARGNYLQRARFRISCSSGTYVRSLVHALGRELGCGAIAMDIYRTRVGNYTIADSLSIIPGE